MNTNLLQSLALKLRHAVARCDTKMRLVQCRPRKPIGHCHAAPLAGDTCAIERRVKFAIISQLPPGTAPVCLQLIPFFLQPAIPVTAKEITAPLREQHGQGSGKCRDHLKIAGIAALAGLVPGFAWAQARNGDSPITVTSADSLGSESQAPEGDKKGLPPGLLEELNAALGPEGVVLDRGERYSHAKPWNSYHAVEELPDAVVFPRNTSEVAAVVRACNTYRVPLVPYGGGTSLEGHTTTPRGGVTIDMMNMQALKEVHEDDLDCVVEAGLGWLDLNALLAPRGLFFPLDPGPGATIGGMCGTRCSGSLAVRYGTMRDNVISIEAVLANGDIVHTASRARKSAAGYDLTRLLIGSEGTLGVITQVTLRLQKIPEASVAAMCTFPSVKDAADVAIATMHSGIQVSRVEFMDEVMMKAVNQGNSYSYPELPTLLFELVGTPAYCQEQVARLQVIASQHSGSNFTFAESQEAKTELWRARKEALWSCALLKPGSEAFITDVCVPLSRLAECIALTKTELDASPLPCPLLAHAGDGNFHVCIMVDPNDPADLAEAARLAKMITERALAMDGTCTGEHGIGSGKRLYLETELGPKAVETMVKIKKALDPNNIMNPGKIFPPKYCL